jgi:CO/xanthine dehydrogenase FAD-binding subunit
MESSMSDKYDAEAELYLKSLKGRALAVLSWFSRYMEEEMADGVILTRVSVSPPAETGRDWRVTMLGRDGQGARFVAYANGESFQGALEAAKGVAEAKGLNWYQDKYWQAKQAGSGQ